MKNFFSKSIISFAFLFIGVAALAQSSLENPSHNSYQSGIGIISGWACNASNSQVDVLIDGKNQILMASGTERGDTLNICGRIDTGLSYLINFNNFGTGQHTAQLRINGQPQGAPVSFSVVVPAGDYARGLAKEVSVQDFPAVGNTTVLVWQESSQNFVIKSVSAGGNSSPGGFPSYLVANYRCSATGTGAAIGTIDINSAGIMSLQFQDVTTGAIYTGTSTVAANGNLSANATGTLGSVQGTVKYNGTFVLLQGASRPQGSGQWISSLGTSGSWFCAS